MARPPRSVCSFLAGQPRRRLPPRPHPLRRHHLRERADVRHQTAEARRRAIAMRYTNEIRHPEVSLPAIPADAQEHVWHLFVVRSKKRAALQQYLAQCGIETLIHYPIPPHRQECYRALGYAEGAFPLTEAQAASVLSLPMSPALTDEQVGHVVEAVNDFAK